MSCSGELHGTVTIGGTQFPILRMQIEYADRSQPEDGSLERFNKAVQSLRESKVLSFTGMVAPNLFMQYAADIRVYVNVLSDIQRIFDSMEQHHRHYKQCRKLAKVLARKSRRYITKYRARPISQETGDLGGR